MVTVVDYEIGNLRSLEKALEHIGAKVCRTDSPHDIAKATHLLLPGVGAFGACISEVRSRGLERPILTAIERGVPFLGVCVGMQMLFSVGLERGEHAGLGVLPGRIIPFAHQEGAYKVPHMGWNVIMPCYSSPLLDGLPEASSCYFVHSFHAEAEEPGDILATTDYGYAFPSVVGRGNTFGVQFHPEKSQRVGLKILENFVRIEGSACSC